MAAVFPERDLHGILDNRNIHKNEAARRWLRRHPRVHFYHTPTHASWVNLVECFCSILSRQGLSQSVHRSQRELQEFLLQFIENHNQTCTPFTWTRGPEHLPKILEATKQYPADHPPPRKRRRWARRQNTVKN